MHEPHIGSGSALPRDIEAYFSMSIPSLLRVNQHPTGIRPVRGSSFYHRGSVRRWRSVSSQRRVFRCKSLRRLAFGLAAAAVVIAPGSDPGWAYFFGHIRAADASGWRSDIWGPGEALVWEAIDDPAFGGDQNALDLISDALQAWADVPTADIRWRVIDVVEGVGETRQDGRNTVFVDADTTVGGYASGFQKRHPERPDVWQTTECDVGLNSNAATSLGVLIHEFGHCLGLGHAARHDPFGPDPIMSYGPSNGIAADDAVGASLLRPAPGWIEGTGNISGRTTFEGEAARFVAIGVIRNDDGAARRILDVLSNVEGEFVAEGLSPGAYVLWVHPIFSQTAFPGPVASGALLEMEDLVHMRPIQVLAGQENEGNEISVRPGRLR